MTALKPQITPELILKAKEEKAYRTAQKGWLSADLSFKLHTAQLIINEKFKASKSQLFVCNVSRQWGKSYWAVTKAIEQALVKPKSQIRYGAAFHSDLVDFIIPAFDKALQDCPGPIKGMYVKSGSYFKFPNGSRIKLVGLDKNPNGLRGNTLDLIIIDECGFVSRLDYLYASVIVPATLHRPNAKIIMISTPSDTPAHPFMDFCQRAELEGGYAEFNIYTNPLIGPDDIARMMHEAGGEESTTWLREYLCKHVVDGDLAIIPEWRDELIREVPRDEYYWFYHKYVGMDLGVKDNTACLFGYYDFKRATCIIEDEFAINGAAVTTERIRDDVKAYEAKLWGEYPPFRRVADNNWPILIQDLSYLHNLVFTPTTKDSLEAMINEVRLMVQNKQLLIHPRCKILIGCLKYGVWEKNKKKFANSKVYGHFDHLAALVYLVRSLAKNSNPIPAVINPAYNTFTAHLDQRNLSNNAKTLGNALIPPALRRHRR